TFKGVGGLNIATKSWQSAGKPRAIMILVHGFNAHSGYMVWPAEQFAAKGFVVYALDLRGRGKSEGERFYVEKFSDYLGDVNKLVDIAKNWKIRLCLSMCSATVLEESLRRLTFL